MLLQSTFPYSVVEIEHSDSQPHDKSLVGKQPALSGHGMLRGAVMRDVDQNGTILPGLAPFGICADFSVLFEVN